jgi:Flp pilus assembly protein TadG
MMKRVRKLSDQAGSAAIEFAIAVPVLISMIWGMFQVALIYEANAGIQQALGEAARYATTYVPSTGTSPTTAQVQAKITSSKFGLRCTSCWTTPVINTTNAAAANGGYWVITVTYNLPTDFLFFQGPTIAMTRSKRVYLSL